MSKAYRRREERCGLAEMGGIAGFAGVGLLRRELTAAGHRFATRSDTEVLVHPYETYGAEMVLSQPIMRRSKGP